MRNALHPLLARRSLRWLVLGIVVALVTAAGIEAAIPDAPGTFHACVLKTTGTIRLIDPSTPSAVRSQCTQLETEVTWNQQGPPGKTDSTVRHFSQFMVDGTTVTSPIVSARGERGKLSIFCGSESDGSHRGVGQITFTTDNASSVNDAVTFVSPSIPTSRWTQIHDHVTFPWADTPGDNVSFEMLIESQIGTSATVAPTLTDIRGFIQHFAFGGCAFYVFVDTSETASAMTFSD